MAGWLDANPKRRKTKGGIARFCNSWLSRAQDKGGVGLATKRSSTSTRDMTVLDELTHDFANMESFRQYCLQKHGQYFSHEGKRVTA